MSGGHRLKASRKRRGLTQKELAAAVGCSQQTVVDIESQQQPASRFLSKIVRELGESLEWIESGLGSPAGATLDSTSLPHFDLEMAGLRAIDPRYIDAQVDSLYSPPLEASVQMYTVGVDRMTSQVMNKTVRADDVLFVDVLAVPSPGSLILVVMPGWERAELRQLGYSSGAYFLNADSDRFGPSTVEVKIYRSQEEYMAHVGDDLPALVCGRVVFIGREA